MIGFAEDGTRLAYNALFRDGKPIERLVIDGHEVYSRWNVENDAVRLFVHGNHYEDGYGRGTGASKISGYYSLNNEGSTASWTEQTKPVPIVTQGATRIYLKEKDTLKGMAVKAEGAYTAVYNLKPKTTYIYHTYDENNNVVESGEFSTEGQVRMLAFKTILNARDIGGWPTVDGGVLNYEKILRGRHLDDLVATDEDVSTLLINLHATADLDLRLANGRYNPADIGLTYYGTEYSGKTVKSDNYGVNAYATMLSNPKNVANCIEAIVTELENGGCVYCHCTNGADRTGTLIAIIMAAMGCTEDAVIKEWELTSFICWCNSKKIDKERTKKDFPQGELRTWFKKLYYGWGGVNVSLQQQAIHWLVNNADVSEEMIERLKAQLVRYD